jgi:hypothetical protein
MHDVLWVQGVKNLGSDLPSDFEAVWRLEISEGMADEVRIGHQHCERRLRGPVESVEMIRGQTCLLVARWFISFSPSTTNNRKQRLEAVFRHLDDGVENP